MATICLLSWCTLFKLVVGQTRIIDIPSCFGVLDSWTKVNFFYLTFSPSNPAFNLRTPDEGILVGAHQRKVSGTCAIALQIPASKALGMVSVYLNKAKITRKLEQSTAQFKLAFFHHNLKNNFETLLDLILTEKDRAEEHVGVSHWPGPITTLYMSIIADGGLTASARVHLSITVTPVYRCLYEEYTPRKAMVAVRQNNQSGYALKFHTDYLVCVRAAESTQNPIGLCVARSLRCDRHNNCPPPKDSPMKYADEPKEMAMCVPRRRTRSFSWKIAYGSFAAFFSLCTVFTLLFLSTNKKSACCKSLWLWLQKHKEFSDTFNTLTDSDLPMAPPRYESIETLPTHKCTVYTLCSRSPKPVHYYESPPSYTRDALDETGVSPKFIRRFYNRHKRYTRSLDARQQNSVSPLLYNPPTVASDVQTEDIRSLVSWTDPYDQNDTEHAAEPRTCQNLTAQNVTGDASGPEISH